MGYDYRDLPYCRDCKLTVSQDEKLNAQYTGVPKQEQKQDSQQRTDGTVRKTLLTEVQWQRYCNSTGVR